MRYLKWAIRILLAVFVLVLLHYNLPQRDIVRIVDTYEERQDFGVNSIFWSSGDAGGGTAVNRDVLFIQTVKANGKVMVYRNEDTGWRWPPYFKFDTADLQARAADAISTKEDPEWYAMKHYGWRSNFLSAFPNAVKLKPVEGPDVTLIPWMNIVIILVLLAVFRTIQVRIRRLWRRIRGTAGEA